MLPLSPNSMLHRAASSSVEHEVPTLIGGGGGGNWQRGVPQLSHTCWLINSTCILFIRGIKMEVERSVPTIICADCLSRLQKYRSDLGFLAITRKILIGIPPNFARMMRRSVPSWCVSDIILVFTLLILRAWSLYTTYANSDKSLYRYRNCWWILDRTR